MKKGNGIKGRAGLGKKGGGSSKSPKSVNSGKAKTNTGVC